MTDDPRWEWLEGDPRLVGVYDIADRLPPLDELADTLRQLHTMPGEPLDQSVRGGTQTDGNLFQRIDPVIVALREAISATVAEHVAQLPPPDPRHPLLAPPRGRPIRFAGAWSVRLSGGGYHANHVHPMGWISSALYIVLPPDLGEGEAGFLTLGEPQAQLKLDLPPPGWSSPSRAVSPCSPSWMWHGTRPFGAGERLTVAFDVAVPPSLVIASPARLCASGGAMSETAIGTTAQAAMAAEEGAPETALQSARRRGVSRAWARIARSWSRPERRIRPSLRRSTRRKHDPDICESERGDDRQRLADSPKILRSHSRRRAGRRRRYPHARRDCGSGWATRARPKGCFGRALELAPGFPLRAPDARPSRLTSSAGSARRLPS